MNTKESKMIGLVALVGLAAVAFAGYQFLWVPYDEYVTQASAQEKVLGEKQLALAKAQKEKKQLDEWRKLALPIPVAEDDKGNAKKAGGTLQPHEFAIGLLRAEDHYLTYLRELMRKHNVEYGLPHKVQAVAAGGPGGKQVVPLYTPVQYTMEARGELEYLVRMLEEFQKTAFLQRITTISIGHQKKGSKDLSLSMTVEALVLNQASPVAKQDFDKFFDSYNAVSRPGLYPVAKGRDYGAFYKGAGKNIFTGKPQIEIVWIDPPKKDPPPVKPPPPAPTPKPKPPEPPKPTEDVISYVVLSDIARVGDRSMAHLWDQGNWILNPLNTTPGCYFPILVGSEGTTTFRGNFYEKKKKVSVFDTDVVIQGVTVVRGDVVRIEDRSVIFRVGLNMVKHGATHDKAYPEQKSIYEIHPEEVKKLLKDGKIKSDDVGHLAVFHESFWKELLRDKVVKEGDGKVLDKGKFQFKHRLISGTVVYRQDDEEAAPGKGNGAKGGVGSGTKGTGGKGTKAGGGLGMGVATSPKSGTASVDKETDLVIVRLDEKYCSYRDEERGGYAVPAHTGYCEIIVGQSMLQGLRSPVPEESLKRLLAVRAP